MIVGQAVDVVIQGVEAGGGDDPGLAHRPSQSLLVPAGPGDRLPALAGQEPADWGAEPLGQAKGDRIKGLC